MPDRYQIRRQANGQGLALTRATRPKKRPIRLTQRGENLVVALYTLAAIVGWGLFLLATIGFAGWLESQP